MARIAKKPITSWKDVPVIFDLPYTALLLGRSVSNLKLLARRGELPAFKVCNEWRVEKEALIAFIENQRTAKEDTPCHQLP